MKPPANQISVSLSAKAAVTPASCDIANGEFPGWKQPLDTANLFAMTAKKDMQA